MGNSLCKEPNLQMCPSAFNRNKPGIHKTYLSRHVLETGPKSNTLNSWQSATLTVEPDGAATGAKVIDRAPVAPPRKKRATLERGTSPVTLKVKNGFKDVFGAESRRQSYDVQSSAATKARLGGDTVDEGLQRRAQSSYEIDAKNDDFSDFSKVPTKAELEKSKADQGGASTAQIPKVGNKKSDKFFGENLSDSLSDVPVVTERRKSAKKGMADLDKIDQFIEQNVLKKEVKPEEREVPKIEVTKSEELKEIEASIIETVVKSPSKKDLKSEEEKQNEENLIKYVDETVGMETSLGKKAEFLMAMLEDYPEDRYLGMTPVDEPIIVPRKRKTRHICDNDEHMHNMLHKHDHDHEVDSSKKMITTEASIETPPRKPERDFAKYLASLDTCSDSDDSNFPKPVRKQRTTRKSLPSPPVPPVLLKSNSESQFRANTPDISSSKNLETSTDTKAHTPRMLKRIISMPSTIFIPKSDSRSTSPLPPMLKSSSSSSFLIKDLQKAQISAGPFTPEDHKYNTADELFKPKSRLAVRKITPRSSETSPYSATPTQEHPAPKFTIGNTEVVVSASNNANEPPPIPSRKKSIPNEPKQTTLLDSTDHPKHPSKEIVGYDLGAFLASSNVLEHHDISQVIHNVYHASDQREDILEEFQSYLEEQINLELNDPNSKNPNTAKLIEALTKKSEQDEDNLENVNIDLVDSDDSNKSSDIDDCFDPEFVKIEKTEVEETTPNLNRQDSGGNCFESGSDVGSVVEGNDKLGNMVTVKSVGPRMGRRESIEDVDSWFQNHNEMSPAPEEIIGVRKQRRGSDGFIAYDTSRQYPFGVVRHRQDSLSADLFEDVTKLHEMGVSKDARPVSPRLIVKEDRSKERRGSDGLILYDTSRKFPFGQPNEDFPKALEEQTKLETTNNESSKTPAPTATKEIKGENNVEKTPLKEKNPEESGTDHSTLLKFLSKENLVE